MMLAMQNPFDDLFMPALRTSYAYARPPAPRHHTRETETEYQLAMPLPGLRPSDIKITCDGDVLTIEGATVTEHGRHAVSTQAKLPRDVNAEEATATSADGVLVIYLPKKARLTHEITVAEGSDALPAPAEAGYQLTLALPGLKPSDIKISSEDGVLTVEGESQTAHGKVKATRRHRLPSDADVTAAVAAAENGILTIVLPKREEPVPRKLEIAIGALPAPAPLSVPDAAETADMAVENSAAPSAE